LLRGVDGPEACSAGEIDVEDDVAEHEADGVVVALEGDVEDAADGASGTVAADDVFEGGFLRGAVGVKKLDVYAFAVLCKRGEGDRALDCDSEGGKMRREDAFGLGLGDAERAVGEIGEVAHGVLRR
jgi:hypothetical protein